MSKLSRSLLALLAVLAMLLLWSGTATADDPPLPPAECLADGIDPETCLPMVEETLTGDPAGEGDGDSGAGGEGEETGGGDGGESEGTDTEGGTAAVQEEDPPSCDDLPETPLPLCELPTCDDLPETPLPLCEEEPPPLEPCETVEDLPLCIPDCEFIAELLGQEGCEFPECIDLTQLPAELVEIIEQLPEELRAELPFCEEEEPPAGNPGGEEPPGGTPVGHENPHYENCDDARAQGAAPVHAGEPGYGPHLDADNDGIGCEEETVVPVSNNTGGGYLAYTGTELGPQLALGGVLLLLGSGLLLAGRRRA